MPVRSCARDQNSCGARGNQLQRLLYHTVEDRIEVQSNRRGAGLDPIVGPDRHGCISGATAAAGPTENVVGCWLCWLLMLYYEWCKARGRR